MSTKTSIKRIAAVAAVALTLGGFSAVSAHAALSDQTTQGETLALSATSSATTIGVKTSIVVTQSYLAGTGSEDTMTVTAGVVSMPAGNSALPSFDSSTVAGYTDTNVTYSPNYTPKSKYASGLVAKIGKDANSAFTSASFKLSFTPALAGTYVFSLTPSFATAETGQKTFATQTWTVTVTAGVLYNSAYISATTTSAPAADDTTPITAAYAASTTPAARITVRQYIDSAKTTLASGPYTQAVTVIATGAGTLGTTNAGPAGTALSSAAVTSTTADSANTQDFYVYPSGVSGTGTITITVGGVAVATKTITFYGSPATATATNNYTVLKTSGGGAGNEAAEIYIADASGNPVVGQAANIRGTSSDATVLNSFAVGAGGCADDSVASGAGYYYCDVTSVAAVASGKSATMTFDVMSGTTVKATTKPITFSTGGTTIYALTTSTDASSYAAGAKVTFTLTAKDKDGNAVADGSYSVFAADAATGEFATSAAVTSPVFTTAALTFLGGVKSTTFYAPYITGSLLLSKTVTGSSLSAALQNLGLGTAVTASVSITNPSTDAAQAAVDAANEATDAANAATDAANNAMDSADAAQQAALDAGDKADAALAAVTDLATKVSAIASQIASLSALVKKIAAKVKA